MRKKLDRVTMILVDTVNYGDAVNSLQKSLKQIEPARTIFFTDTDLKINLPEVEIIKIPTINSKEEYSRFIVKELWKFIDTEFVLVTQHDGFVLCGDAWDDKFYENDYTGACWQYIDGRNVGNGGFSLRTQRLQAILGNDPQIEVYHPEDAAICRLYRNFLEVKHKVRFAKDDLADHFSYELNAPVYKTFGKHGNFHEPYKETIMITRMGALGDVIALEPLLHYYYKNGYKVALNTSPQFINYFGNHYFKIHHPMELDTRTNFKEIRLDNAYEVFPKQLHLKSYYDMCGIVDGEIRNPKLQVEYDHKQFKLFDKYVVLHLDKRDQASRNIEGIDWEAVVDYLNENGYDVLQLGIGIHDVVKNATFMHTPSSGLVMAVVGSANLFIGIDSALSNIAVAMDVPKSIIFFGSVNPEYIIPDLTNVIPFHNHGKNVCDKAFCWHETRGQTGTKCYIDDANPPCNKFSTIELLNHIKAAIT